MVPAPYARVMFLGVGGSGKSSVLDGLMNKKCRTAESTALADTLNIRYHWVEAADAAEEAWKLVQEEDELEELASLGRKVLASKTEGTGDEAKAEASIIKKWATAQAVLFFAPVLANTIAVSRAIASEYSRKATEVQSEMTQEIIERAQRQGETSHLDKGGDVVMRVWDCGGQQVFLDILSAFLTPRTMFIQVFNASQPLNSKYLESWRHNGRTYPGKEQNITILKHMMQWMQLIHASLVEKKEGTPANEASRDGATASNEQGSGLLPKWPKIMIVGTHGDQLELEDKTRVLNELESSCEGKAFNDIVIDRLVIDNTTAGQGKAKEDPGYQNIRKEISKFANSLSIPTPIAWVSFRKVLQKSVDSIPILSYEQIIPIAEECGIPKSVVPSLLRFYHEMGVFLHYTSIMSLSTTVIIDPQWLIKQLCKILMPEWYSDRPEGTKNLWQFLETYGILVEPLYHEVWRDCGLRGGAQAIVDLLDHFDLAKKITSVPREVKRHQGQKYFIPCMLKNLSQEDVKAKKRDQLQRALKEAAKLHIKFNTEYVPPGFFVRLAAHLTDSKKCKPLFEVGTHRNCINFSYNEIDRVTISESLSGASIQVDMMRVAKRTPLLDRFADSCLAFRNELSTICNEVQRWLPSIKFYFAFKCSCSATEVEHFALIDDTMHQLSSVCCHNDGECEIKSEHKCWLQPSPLKRKVSTVLFSCQCMIIVYI